MERRILADARKKQVDEVVARREQDMKDKIAIGEAMRKRAQEMLEEDARTQEAKQQRARANRDQVVAANERLKALRIELAKEEKRAQEIRDAEVKAVEDRSHERKAIEQRFQEKVQVKRQALIDAAIKKLQEAVSHEEEILDKQAADIRQREDSATSEKEERQRQEQEAIEMIQSKREAWDRECAENDRLQRIWREENEAAMEEERQKIRQAKERNKELKAIQHSDAMAMRQKKVDQKLSQIEADRILQASEGDVDAKFIRVCKETIKKYEDEGKPTYPLKVALHYKEPVLIGAKLNKAAPGATKQ